MLYKHLEDRFYSLLNPQWYIIDSGITLLRTDFADEDIEVGAAEEEWVKNKEEDEVEVRDSDRDDDDGGDGWDGDDGGGGGDEEG